VALSAEIEKRGFKSSPLAASVRTDTVNIKGDFPPQDCSNKSWLGLGRSALSTHYTPVRIVG
jgi:hypothetical protein